jgi:hypothetical protein
MYTLEGYEKAKAGLKELTDLFDRYSGNNPDKYQADIKMAWSKLRIIEAYLKEAGILPLNDQERLELKLDKAFPGAMSKQIVEFDGKRYQRRFFPLEKSRSRKTVREWGKSWVEVRGTAE